MMERRAARTTPEENERLAILKEVRQAQMEWVVAIDRFNWITDPDLIDHAVFAMDAAEKRYTYLLRLAKKMRIYGL
jgi:hypothetical protein